MPTQHDRLKIVWDFERLKNVARVAEIHEVGADTVRRWVKIFEETVGVALRIYGLGLKLKWVQRAAKMWKNSKIV